MTLKNALKTPENAKERLKDALKRYRTGINFKMLRDAEGTLDPWNVGGRRSKERYGKRSRHKKVSITVIIRNLH
jgi:hypothetical protein